MSNVTAIRQDVPLAASALEPDAFLTPEQVVELVPSLSVRTLREWRAEGRGIPYVRISPKRVAYIEADVRAWMLAHRQTVRSTS